MKLKQKLQHLTDEVRKKLKRPEKQGKKLSKKERIKKEALDWAVSIAIAVTIYFVILPAILGTSSPMVVVASCSQAPHLNIGDIIILRGTQIEDVKAPTINIEQETTYHYNEAEKTLHIGNEEIKQNTTNDIVVYHTEPKRTQVIHRALAKLNTTQGKYLLTQGDANEIPDQVTQQKIEGERRLCLTSNPNVCLSTAVNDEMLVGRKAGWRIPILGHVKLFFCDVLPLCEGHSNLGTNYEYKLTC